MSRSSFLDTIRNTYSRNYFPTTYPKRNVLAEEAQLSQKQTVNSFAQAAGTFIDLGSISSREAKTGKSSDC